MNRLLSFVIIAIQLVLFNNISLAQNQEKKVLEAEKAELIGGPVKIADESASGGQIISLAKPGDGIMLTDLPAASKLAIRYASVKVGTFSIAVNNQPVRKVNVHSSGALTGYYLYAIIDITIPSHSTSNYLNINSSDVEINIDHIVVGKGDLGPPPDIWNLPDLRVAMVLISQIGKK